MESTPNISLRRPFERSISPEAAELAFFLTFEVEEREEREPRLLPEVLRLLDDCLPRRFATVWQVPSEASDYSTRVLRQPPRRAKIRP